MTACVTFSADTVVYVVVKGQARKPHQTLDDGGLVSRFLEWQLQSRVFPVFTRSVGGGAFYGAFWLDDARRAEQWLVDNGAEET